MRPINLSTFTGTKDNKPRKITENIDNITKALLYPIPNIKSKGELPMWSPTIFKGTRSGANAIHVSFLVYDIDDGLAPIDAWRLFTDTAVICHSSWSHAPHWHKYRIIIPLANPVPAEYWHIAHVAALEYWDLVVGRGAPDMKALKDVARCYYRYSVPDSLDISPKTPREYHQTHAHIEAPLLFLDYSHIKIEEKKQYKPQKTQKICMSEVMINPVFRSAAADKLGSKVVGNTARYITCPLCKRDSVYFSINLDMPNAQKWPKCNHENSCSWWGNFESLLGSVL
tara:strand:- start:494 stop:1345 length:852 start_codon:yes stop_codon:yes gene_type:complete